MTVRTRKSTASDAYTTIAILSSQLRALTQTRHTTWGSSGASFDALRMYLSDLLRIHTELNVAKNVPGVAQAAKDAEDDQSYAVVTEVTTLQGLMIDVKDRVTGDIPVDGSGWTLGHKFNADGSDNWRNFSSAALANLLTDMQAVIDAVDA